jgi:hypothetical protein
MTRGSKMDGGRAALAGFLYQIVALLGMTVRAFQGGQARDSDELETLISYAKDRQIAHESLGQDAVIYSDCDPGEGIALVQFKYSGSLPPRKIYKGEFDEIIERFFDSERMAINRGFEVSRFILVTNRERCKDSTESHESTTARKKPSPGKQKSNSSKKRNPRQTESDKRKVEIRNRLQVFDEVSSGKWIGKMKNFADSYGCDEIEFRNGIDQLTGKVFRETSEGSENVISHDDLKEAFTGSPSITSLEVSSLEGRSVKETEKILNSLKRPGKPIRRRLLDKLSESVPRRGLIILEGEGGCGKSTALAHWALELLKLPSPRPGTLIAICQSRTTSENWITNIICEWTNVPFAHLRRHDQPQRALERLAKANRDAPAPIFIMGFDGFDERNELGPQMQSAEIALRWFAEEDQAARMEGRQPTACMIVACRSSEEIKDIIKTRISGFDFGDDDFQIIPVEEFTHAELAEAAKSDLGSEGETIRRELVRAGLLKEPYRDNLLGSSETADVRPTVPLTASDLLSSLHHPAMWQAFLTLDQDERAGVIGGQPEAIAKLAKVFTRWFLRKIRGRRPGWLNSNQLLMAICQVAAVSKGSGVFKFDSGWIKAASSDGELGRSDANTLFQEALSAGYIRKNSGESWRWRHPSCVKYLVIDEDFGRE